MQKPRETELLCSLMKHNTVAEHNSSPQRLLERQLTFELSETLAIRCLGLAGFKLLTLQNLDLQQCEPVLNCVSSVLSCIIHTLSVLWWIPCGLSTTTVLICVGPSSHRLRLVIRRWQGRP